MDFQLTHEQVLIQESMRKMVERDINPILKSQDPDKPLTREVTRQIIDICAPLGLTGLRLPEDAGGAGVSALTFGGVVRLRRPGNHCSSVVLWGHPGAARALYPGPSQR